MPRPQLTAAQTLPLLFQRLRNRGQPSSDLARHPGGFPRRVQAHRVGPDARQPFADVRAAQVLQIDTEGLPVGELSVVLSLAGEVGIGLDHVPHIDNRAVCWHNRQQ
jgi:hypothetical protein